MPERVLNVAQVRLSKHNTSRDLPGDDGSSRFYFEVLIDAVAEKRTNRTLALGFVWPLPHVTRCIWGEWSKCEGAVLVVLQ